MIKTIFVKGKGDNYEKILNKAFASTIASILAVSAMPLAFNSIAAEDNALYAIIVTGGE